MSSELVSFLLARLDEDEALATDALTRDHWAYEGYGDFGPYVSGAMVETEDSPQGQQIAQYLVTMNPWRVLAEVEAKRAIVDVHFGSEGDEGRWWCNACADGAYGDKADWPCPTLRLLALPYADHLDYDETWRP